MGDIWRSVRTQYSYHFGADCIAVVADIVTDIADIVDIVTDIASLADIMNIADIADRIL